MSGPEGVAWVEEYSVVKKLEDICTKALYRFRRGGDGWLLMKKVREIREGLEAECSASVVAVLDRWINGVEGYGYYVDGDLDSAATSMRQAHENVVAAVSETRCLIPMANQCMEFETHLARIARNRGDWAEMWEHINIARDMTDGSIPLCTLRDGQTVDYNDLYEYYRKLDGLTSKEERDNESYFQVAERRKLFDQFIERLLSTVSPEALSAV